MCVYACLRACVCACVCVCVCVYACIYINTVYVCVWGGRGWGELLYLHMYILVLCSSVGDAGGEGGVGTVLGRGVRVTAS